MLLIFHFHPTTCMNTRQHIALFFVLLLPLMVYQLVSMKQYVGKHLTSNTQQAQQTFIHQLAILSSRLDVAVINNTNDKTTAKQFETSKIVKKNYCYAKSKYQQLPRTHLRHSSTLGARPPP